MSERRDDNGDAESDGRTPALIGVVVILVLAILGVLLVRELGRKSSLEDCLMSGRTNCAPIDVPQPR